QNPGNFLPPRGGAGGAAHDERAVTDQRQYWAVTLRNARADNGRGAPAHAMEKSVVRDVARGRFQEWRGKAEEASGAEKNRHLGILLGHDLGSVVTDACVVERREVGVP